VVTATATEIINSAASELGLPTVSLTTSTGDTLAQQSLALLNALGDELIRIHDWQFLEKVMTFTGDGTAASFPLPADFRRQINQTQWDNSGKRPLYGPDSPQMWSWSQYGIVSVGIFFRYRILDNEYAIFPVPGDGTEFDLYYISKNWVIDGIDPQVTKDKVTRAEDVPMFDRRLLITGLKVKLWAAKGFDTKNLQEEFNFVLAAEKGQNQGARAINLSGGDQHLYLNYLNIPETGYGA
jgi:hypothetical protein